MKEVLDEEKLVKSPKETLEKEVVKDSKKNFPLVPIVVLVGVIIVGIILFFLLNKKKDPRSYMIDSIKSLRSSINYIAEPLSYKTRIYDKTRYTSTINFAGTKLNSVVLEDSDPEELKKLINRLSQIENKTVIDIDSKSNLLKGNIGIDVSNTNLLNLDFLYKDKSAYIIFKDIMSKYIEFEFETMNEADLDKIEDIEYLVDFIIKKAPTHIKDKDFKSVEETIKFDGKDTKVVKYYVALDSNYMDNIIKGVYDDIEKDKRASEIMEELSPGYKENIMESGYSSEDFITYSFFVKNSEVLKTNFEVPIVMEPDYTSDTYETEKQMVNISFSNDKKRTIEIIDEEKSVFKMEFEDGDSGYNVELILDDVNVFNLTVINKDSKVITTMVASSIAEYSGTDIKVEEVTDYSDDANIKTVITVTALIKDDTNKIDLVYHVNQELKIEEIDKV